MILDQPLEFTVFAILTAIFGCLFLYSRDLVQKQLAMFIASYFIFVFFSDAIFGKDFSSKTYVGNYGIDAISVNLIIFWVCFYLSSNIKLGHKASSVKALRCPGGRGTSLQAVILAIPVLVFFGYYTSRNGIRMTGDFLEYRGERSTLTDYVFVYYAAILSFYRKSRMLLVVGLVAALSHFFSAERLRSFVYIILILINYYRIDTRRYMSSVIFLVGFLVATFVGLLRTGSLAGNQDYNITHFGSVTVSSLYLLDFGSTIETGQRIMFSVGTVIANLVPSSLVPDAYNIRTAILSFAAIPGGGWLPVFFTVQAGLVGVISSGFIVGHGYRRLLSSVRGHTVMQPAFYAATIVFIATTPRWFMYTPYQLVKMPLYAFMLTALLIFLGRLTSRKRMVHGA